MLSEISYDLDQLLDWESDSPDFAKPSTKGIFGADFDLFSDAIDDCVKNNISMDSMDTSCSSASTSTSSGYQTSSTTSDSNSDPIVIKEEVKDIEEYKEETKVKKFVIRLNPNKFIAKRRPRGRPRIDPKQKAINKKMNNMKASIKYRKKEREYNQSINCEYNRVDIKNKLLKTDLINKYNECQKLLILCNKIKVEMRAKDRKNLEKSEKNISSVVDNSSKKSKNK